MASTLEMFIAGIALLVNTFAIMLMYFINSITLGPIIDFAGRYVNNTATMGVVPLWDMTYIPSAIFGILLIMEIVIIIAFVAVAGRRVVVDDLY